MPKTGKKGHERLDKYYYLAKDQGYRARSAFKLIQLNKKFNFLGTCRALIDLCAAPGGWCQVAQKNMPLSSVIVGVDIVPIKPIPNVITLTEDITTAQCRNELRRVVKTWKVDVVLHDGSPNVGTAWVQDAFTQSELVIAALKLATEFLQPGGWFVTKVFRSNDYLTVLNVLGKFFKKVTATKPAASRDVSAEVFVVCEGYLAPKHPDQSLLDPKTVFAEKKDAEGPLGFNSLNLLKKPKANGYSDDSGALLHSKMEIADFINSTDPVRAIASHNQFCATTDESKKIFEAVPPSEDLKEFFNDIGVIGKTEYKAILKWRLQVRRQMGLDEKPKVEKLSEKERAEMNDMNKFLLDAERAASRQEKKERRLRAKKQRRIDLKMDLEGDRIEENDLNIFSLKSIKSKNNLDELYDDVNMGQIENISDSEDEMIIDDYKPAFSTKNAEQDDENSDEIGSDSEVFDPLKERKLHDEEIDEELERNYRERKAKQEAMGDKRVLKVRLGKTNKTVILPDIDPEKDTIQTHLPQNVKRLADYVPNLSSDPLAGLSEDESDDSAGFDEEQLTQSDASEAENGGQKSTTRSGKAKKAQNAKKVAKDSEHDQESEDDEVETLDESEARDTVSKQDDSDEEEFKAIQAMKERYKQIDDEDRQIEKELDEKLSFVKKGLLVKLPEQRETSDWFSGDLNEEKLNEEEEAMLEKLKEQYALKRAREENEREKERVMRVKERREEKKRKLEEKQRAKETKELGDDDGNMDAPGDEGKKKKMTRAERAQARKEKREARNPKNIKKEKRYPTDDFEVVPQEEPEDFDDDIEEMIEEANAEQAKNTELIGPQMGKEKLSEALAIGTAMVTDAKRRQAIIDGAYNRYAFNDEDLPEWFAEEEARYNTPEKPITKEEVMEMRQRFMDINARPIKKIAEAKARKRLRLEREMERVRAKATQIANSDETSNGEKMRQIDKLYRSMSKKNLKRKSKRYVIGKTGKTVGGDKSGKVKLVDKRMKKELRAKQRIEKRKGGKGRR